MKQMLKALLPLAALCGVALTQAATCDTDCPTLKCYKRRSDSRHKYIQLAGSMDKAHIGDPESMYGVFTITPGYRGSFRPKSIARCLFGDHLSGDSNCCDQVIKIEGSAIANRDPKAWLADYFYLPRNAKGTISFEPRIKTFFLDLDLFVGLDDWLCGLYFRLWGDVVHSSWNLNLCEKGDTEGTPLDHQHGYFSPAEYDFELLVKSFTDYAKGGTPDKSTDTENITPNGPGNGQGIQNSTLVFQSLRYAKMLKCSRSETGFADLRFELGWDFWQSDCYHLGLNLQFAAPTGQKKEPCFLFDAMVGNGNHWELGGGITGHYVFWRSEDSDSHFSFHLDANLTHLFKERHQRTFDLTNRPNSAYMLASKFGANGPESPPNDQIKRANDDAIDKQFAGEYAPVANLSTTSVDVSIGVQADIVVMMNYTCGGFSWDLGYNFWGHSCEKLECPESCKNSLSLCNAKNLNTWALKGDARMFGFTHDVGTLTCDNTSEGVAIPLSATQTKKATILSGTNKVLLAQVATIDNCSSTDINSGVDTPVLAVARIANVDVFNIPRDCDPADQINTSSIPCFLKCEDLDFTRIKGTSHTIFTNLAYTWDHECWVPFLGIGVSAEFASNGSCCDDDISKTSSGVACGPCVNCAVSQWSVWLQGGLTFN